MNITTIQKLYPHSLCYFIIKKNKKSPVKPGVILNQQYSQAYINRPLGFGIESPYFFAVSIQS
jgi:hypothetical protein